MNKKVLLRQLQISWIPLLLAVAYASIAYCMATADKRSVMTFVNYFSGTFFFLMWIVGQYLRTSKEINDSSNYANLQTGILDLKKAISKLQAFSFQQPKTTATFENPLLATAKKAIDSGFVLAGLMQAGVAFEQALLAKADKLQIARDNRTNVSQILNRLKDFYDQGTINEFYAVWKLRNQLVHLSNEASIELEKNPSLFKYFEWAIKTLESEN